MTEIYINVSLINFKRLAYYNKLRTILVKCSSYSDIEETNFLNINKIILSETFKIAQPPTAESLYNLFKSSTHSTNL